MLELLKVDPSESILPLRDDLAIRVLVELRAGTLRR